MLRKKDTAAPIIMLSGNAIEDQRDKMTSHLHNDYLIKPIRLETLLEKIGTALHINWSYHDKEKLEQTAVEIPLSSGSQLPAHADLEELISMAKIGYLNGVLEKLEALEKANIDSAFLQYLKSRAELCDFDGLIQTIKGLSHGA